MCFERKCMEWGNDSWFYFHFVVKSNNQNYLGKNEFIWLILPGHNHHWGKSKEELKAGKRMCNCLLFHKAVSPPRYSFKPKNLCKKQRGCYLLTYPLRGLASFLIEPRNTCLGIMSPMVDWTCPHQFINKTIP